VKASAIIVAAGSGQRLGRSEPKAFVKIGGHALLYYALASIGSVAAVEEIVITVPRGMEAAARAEASGLAIPVKITEGGAERQDSVRIALALTSAESELVMIHDAARPFAEAQLFEKCLEAARRSGGAIAAVLVSDTLKRGADNIVAATVPRTGLWQAQTPQAFQRAIILTAYEHAATNSIVATDDAGLVEHSGARVELVESSTLNLKITTPADLILAEAILTSRA
jgi:2-C-methyl-D-erythritol 4-phosphate cytidylyltransferase